MQVKCPFCKKGPFAVRTDNSLAKCLSCFRYLTAETDKPWYYKALNRVLTEIFFDWHQELLAPTNPSNKTVREFLFGKQNLVKEVVDNSMLGIVPTNYDIGSKFGHLIATLDQQSTQQKGKGRTSKAKWITPEKFKDLVVNRAKELNDIIHKFAGKLAFFYTDENHQITFIKFYNPTADKSEFWRFFKETSGLFGHGLFSHAKPDYLDTFEGSFLVLENELSLLQLQKLSYMYAKSINKAYGYFHACAVGDVFKADFDTIRKVNPNPTICYNNNSGGLGYCLVEKALTTMNLSAFTTPSFSTNLGSFILSQGKFYQNTWKTFLDIFKDRKSLHRDYSGLQEEILDIREDSSIKKPRKEKKVADVVRDDLNQRGTFYHDEFRSHFFSSATKNLITISKDNIEFLNLMDNYGINGADKIYDFVLNDLGIKAYKKGQKAQVHNFAYYDDKACVLYLFDQNNGIYKITSDTVEHVDNGTDGILFVKNNPSQPFKYIQQAGRRRLHLFRKLVINPINFASGILNKREQRWIFRLWIFFMFFVSKMRNKPIMVIGGEPEGGKSTAVRRVGTLLFGNEYEVMGLPADEDKFDTTVTNSFFTVFDNLEKNPDWLADRLCIIATGGTISKRVLYKTNQSVNYRLRCYVAFTTMGFPITRKDVVSRLILLRTKALKEDSQISETILQDEVINNRDLIMSEVIDELQKIVAILWKFRNEEIRVSFRATDFATFAIKVMRGFGKADLIRLILKKLKTVQKEFSRKKLTENEILIKVLNLWVPLNEGRNLTTHDLFYELSNTAKQEGLNLHINGKNEKGKVRSFGHKMGKLLPLLKQMFKVERLNVRSRGRKWVFHTKKK